MKIYVAHAGKFDFENELYKPLEKSTLSKKHTFFFPEREENKYTNTKEIIKKNIDFLIAEVSYPATGLGIELGRAESAEIPILGIYRKGKEFTKSIRFVIKNFVEYENENDMIKKIQDYISKN